MSGHHYSDSFDGAWIHIGPWLNYNNNILSVLTFTGTKNAGLILVSFLAAFITMVGSFTWSTCCYIIHQWRAKNKEQDGQHHQEQALLRNVFDDKRMMWEIVKVGWAWKSISAKSKRRTLALFTITFVHFGIFAVAAYLSSRIYISNSDVLIKNDKDCGFLPIPSNMNLQTMSEADYTAFTAVALAAKSTANWALSYSRQCYGPKPGSSCHLFPVPSINSTVTTVACPFASSVCLDPKAGIQIDSGMINTAKDLGMNTIQSQSLNYRKVLTCAPLNTGRFRSFSEPTLPNGTHADSAYVQYGYGTLTDGTNSNVTFRTNLGAYLHSDEVYPSQWQLAVLNNTGASTFNPIKELRPNYEADLSLIYVSQAMQYLNKVNDLWINATLVSNISTAIPWYETRDFAMVMGCTEQHQICKPDGPCTPLTGIEVLGNIRDFKGNQLMVGAGLYRAQSDNSIAEMFNTLGGRALLANTRVLYAGVQVSRGLDPVAPMPTWWSSEVLSWQQFTLANLQRRIINIAAGVTIDSSSGPDASYFDSAVRPIADVIQFDPGADTGTIDLCKSLRTVDANFVSVHIVGVIATVIVGLLLIVLDLCLPTVVGKIQLRFNKGVKRQEDWAQDHVIHIQRHAFEKSGATPDWTGHEKDVPTTTEGHRFHSLSRHSIHSLAHLGRPSAVYSPGMSTMSPMASPDLNPLSPTMDPFVPNSPKPAHSRKPVSGNHIQVREQEVSPADSNRQTL